MLNVSEEYLIHSREADRVVNIRGSITKYGAVTDITQEDISAGSVSTVSKAVGGTSFNIGEVFVDSLQITLGGEDLSKWGDLSNSELHMEYGQELGTPNDFEWLSLGYWDIPFDGIKVFSKTVQVTANSRMVRFDKSLGGVVTSGKPYEILNWICLFCDMELGVLEAEVNAMPNGNQTVSLPADSGCETYRDLLMWVVSMLAGFATISRDGKLVVKQFSGDVVYNVNKHTIASSSYAEDVIDIQNVEMSLGDSFFSVDSTVPQSKTLTLDSNPLFLSNEISAVRLNRVTAIRDAISSLGYLPFKIEFNGDASLEVGDHITIGDSDRDCLITSILWKYRGKCTLEGAFYSNNNTKKQSVKGSSGGGSGGGDASNHFSVTRYENAGDIDIKSAFKQVFVLSYELEANSVPQLCFLAVMDVVEAGTFELQLTYDNATLYLSPKQYCQVGYHNYMITLNLVARDAQMVHTLRGRMRSVGGEAHIAIAHINASVTGWGIASSVIEWDGKLDLQDDVPMYGLGWSGIELRGISEEIEIGFEDAIIEEGTSE